MPATAIASSSELAGGISTEGRGAAEKIGEASARLVPCYSHPTISGRASQPNLLAKSAQSMGAAFGQAA